MAREPQVTRTITTTKVVALVANTITREMEEREFILPRTYADDKKLAKAIEKAIIDETIKFVSVVDKEVQETLYGMTEAEFIAVAKVLPPRTIAENK